MIYISRGNVPSRASNALQTMKMASAFSKLISDFRLLINVSIFNFIDFSKKFDMRDFYYVEEINSPSYLVLLIKISFSLQIMEAHYLQI